MELKFKDRYKDLSDKEIVDKIITKPYDEEGAVFLIYDRYEPVCISTCLKSFGGLSRLDELQSELYILLKGSKLDWSPLRSFKWRSKFGTWFKIITYNHSIKLRKKLIENDGKNTSLDSGKANNNQNPKPIDVPVDEEKNHERAYRKLLLNEVINKLENNDQKFVVKNRLDGYSSKEVASMLDQYWKQNNIVKYNNKKEIIIPDSGYIDNIFKRGYDIVKKNFKLLDK